MKSVIVNNVRVDYFPRKDDVINLISSSIYISIAGEAIYKCDKDFIDIVNSENSICFADGEMGVLALKKAGFKKAIKIPGCELWIDLLEKHGAENTFIIGSSEEVSLKVKDKLSLDYGVEPLFCRNGYLTEEDIVLIEKKMMKLSPKLVVIAQGQPMQEQLAARLYKVHVCDYICIGGALDVYSGNIKRAPKLFIRLKLEWLYRLFKQPVRLKRQLVLFSVLYHILFDKKYLKHADI